MAVVEPGPLIGATLPEGHDADAVDVASAVVRAYCGWHIAPVLTTDVVCDGPGSTTLILPTLRLQSINSCTVSGPPDDGIAPTVVDLATEVEWSEAGVVRGPFRTKRLRSIMINITHGYDACPPEIRAVVLGLSLAGIAPSRIKSQLSGSLMITWTDEQSAGAVGLSQYDMAILDRYTLPGRS